MCNLRIVTALNFIVMIAVAVSADMIDITLLSNAPYVSDELKSFLPSVNPSYEPSVGFNTADIGDGTGDGLDEAVAFSFIFQPLTEVETAYLTVDLTPRGTSTDELLFADNFSIRGEGNAGAKFYGNEVLETLTTGIRTSVTFDLKQMDYTDPYRRYLGTEDLSIYLNDGDFNVVYADDAIIHSARLRINTGLIEVPPQPPVAVPEADVNSLCIVGLVFTVFLAIFRNRERYFNQV